MATDVESVEEADAGLILKGVSWKLYSALRELVENDHVRMSYLDGTLILMSPQYIHERGATDLAFLLVEVGQAHAIEVEPVRTTTLRLKGQKKRKGTAKEADEGFYLGEHAELMRQKDDIDLAIDPPPDLAIEVDNKADSKYGMKIYARLRVPEVWRFTSGGRELWFGTLQDDSYRPIVRSLGFPMLTPELVLQALDTRNSGGGMGLVAWKTWLAGWARTLPAPPHIP